jgi:hypothetical protein
MGDEKVLVLHETEFRKSDMVRWQLILYDTHSGKKEDGRLVDHSMSQNFYK